ncbi:MAG: IS21 family transposase, partial [Deltaproteobacteria bacterium]
RGPRQRTRTPFAVKPDSRRANRAAEAQFLDGNYEVQALLRAGVPQLDVAAQTGISVRSVRRIARKPPVTAESLVQPPAKSAGRPSVAAPWRSWIVERLAGEPHLLTVELLRRARLAGYDGGKSAFYGMAASVRPKPKRVETRFEGLPGEFSQHDFGQTRITYADGTEEVVHFFASRLKWSRFCAVSLVPNQRAESLVRALARHLVAFGGVPLRCVFDRPRTVARKWRKDGTVTDWNPLFAQAMVELGFVAELCWPYRPNQKGSVEHLVGWVKGSFFKQRRFHDREDLEQQLAEWLVEINLHRPCRATKEIPETRRQQELERFRPVRLQPQELALRVPVHVGPTAEVRHPDYGRYSMPPEAAGIPGTLFLYEDRVRIVAGRHVRTHDRVGPGELAMDPEDRAARLKAVSGRRGRSYQAREDLLALGEPALAFLTELVHRRPHAWQPIVLELHACLQRDGPDALRQALAAAVQHADFTLAAVHQALRQPTLFPQEVA